MNKHIRKLSKQFCSLKLAKQLAELGVSQESLFYWTKFDTGGGTAGASELIDYAIRPENELPQNEEYRDCFSAFTSGELGEMLPGVVLHHYDSKRKVGHSYLLDTRQTLGIKNGKNYTTGWYIRYLNRSLNTVIPSQGVPFIEADTEADARAKTLIYLIENDIISVDDIHKPTYEDKTTVGTG